MENEYVRLMLLPEIGGRIHIGFDKTAGYDFFYRNNVIKPGLVGLARPWISGGVEFNWPQHHRPATFLPVETSVERRDGGQVTLWHSDLDPLQRMRGTHGVRLRPGSSLIEVEARLYNRTDEPQTFLCCPGGDAAGDRVARHRHRRVGALEKAPGCGGRRLDRVHPAPRHLRGRPIGRDLAECGIHTALDHGIWGMVLCSNAAQHHPPWANETWQHRMNNLILTAPAS
ncbi:DUF5107 domain-containing protein [Arthrobacter sp. W4I7]|uniref:DUF5107 domain-containing protein n=1 Tax=Arthrobacter sp. W4I7 TaxID=3042296 RepID=UPI002783CA54|nr:DUF5107 domain-containing protein [Arthrobacter sp. W4I7]MDQ0691126.1 hypothetical protein [Arthrobacter sp. W4I7]